ncbi:uncharacterized protein LOC116344361 isoform X3 [Contarinia nasturtii]|uniref:uncharacterized protein LOC116344361 isoform X3 n=1 Tax=Contarinia nasturtii TaxID=265458 RepID=UPI0012D428AE|nr:uncharacterized protein LOC116344361 isoform X3 [Contarinia nasturtii]
MGKCASKQQLHHREFLQPKYNWSDKSNGRTTVNGKKTRSSISEQSIFLLIENEGQTESKKRSRSVETKGTAMSFGFKKKLPPQKRNTLTDNGRVKDNGLNSINGNHLKTDNACCINGDDNGNSVESIETLSDSTTVGRSTPRLTPPKKESAGAPYRSTRFGFRINRPSSTGISASSKNCENVINNNHSEAKLNVKPRSKSACGSRRSIASSTTSNESHQRHPTVHFQLPSPTSSPQKQFDVQQLKKNSDPKIDNESTTVNNYANSRQTTQMQRKMFFMQSNPIQNTFNQNKPPSGKRSYTIINTELHTNEIHRPTPQAATTIVSKFTLHTTSLPKPQYPVPVSLAPRHSMDVKNAKQAANTTTKKSGGGFQAQREISADSGIGSISSHGSGIDLKKSPQRQRRPRNLEMVFSGRNKFHVRDLTEDSFSDDNVQPLALPQLPTAFSARAQPANISGLIRATNNYGNKAKISVHSLDGYNNRLDPGNRQTAHSSDGKETIEEEKLEIDNKATEKLTNHTILTPAYGYLSKSPSVTSNSITGMCIGEELASKDGISLSSTDTSRQNNNQNEYDDDISTITLSTDNKITSISSTTMPQSQFDPLYDELSSPMNGNDVMVTDQKFAAITAAMNDILIDDETSPSDSLISSTASDDLSAAKKPKNNKKKMIESIRDGDEKDINEVSPIFEMASPISHGTPTHATNSFSFSDCDGGRDFLIDDEIADQPVLCFGDNQASNTQLHSLVDTPTLKENSSAKSSIKRMPSTTSNNNSATNSYAPQARPRQSLISRAESLDTLSPCESICSDDLMMDFECNSSIDSIDRASRSNRSGIGDVNSINGSTTKVNKLDEAQLWTEFEQNGGGHFKDWSYLLKTSRNKFQDISVSQLPARSTRLLNRSRLQHNASLNGLESPRSIENLHSINKTVTTQQFGRDSANGSPDEQLFMLDKTLRNSMIQDVQYCKQQLLQLRSILQETASLNPFESNNGKFFDASGEGILNSVERDNYSPSLSDDPKHDLVDLRRQVVYLQSQLDDKDRTIRIQQNLINKLEAEMDNGKDRVQTEQVIDTVNTATQTDRVRPLSMNFDGSNRNLSTAIFFTLNNFWLFDRKYFYQTFRSYVQRIFQLLPHSTDYRLILPSTFSLPLSTTSIHSLAMNMVNRLSMPLYNEHITIFRSFAFRKFMPNISLLSIAYVFHSHINGRSTNHSYLLSNIVFAIQSIFTSTNCNFLL